MTAYAPRQGNGVGAAPFAVGRRLLEWFRSEEFRQAVRVALAMVIAYYVSLAMDWDRPHWACLAVSVCSLATTGDSVNKGLLRILGTVMAGFFALLLIGLFPQQRWLYLLCATAYVAFCTYMVGRSSRGYVWMIAGAVMLVLTLAGGATGATLFETVILRTQQTIMGVIVYTLVALLLWPRNAAPVLTHTASSLADIHRRLLGHYIAVLAGMPEESETSSLRAQATGTLARFPAVLEGALLDSFDVWETRRLWRRYGDDCVALDRTMERWRLGFQDIEKLDLRRLMPGLPVLGAELDARLTSVTRMHAGMPPQQWPEEVALAFDEGALESVGRFDRAALLRSRDQLQRIEQLTRALFDSIADIHGCGSKTQYQHPVRTAAPSWTIDPDLLASAVRSFAAVWIILLVWIYTPGLPMPAGVIPIVAVAAINVALIPYFPVGSLVVPSLGSVAFAGAFQILVMPHLTTFIELGTGIFIAIFLICSLFAKPEQVIARSIGLGGFVTVISVRNQQTYDFLFVLNFALALQLALIAVWVSTWFPISFSPQRVIFSQLRRFLTSCDRLASIIRQDPGHELRGMRVAFHVHEMTTLPGKIGRWMAAVPGAAHGSGTPQQAEALVNSLHALSNRMRELVELRDAPQSEAIVRELLADVHAWHLAIQEILRRVAVDPASVEAALLRSRLDAKLAALESRIASALNAAPEGSASPEEVDNMYRLLGAYRGVSEALVEFVRCAERIDWQRLREARF